MDGRWMTVCDGITITIEKIEKRGSNPGLLDRWATGASLSLGEGSI